MSFFRGWKKSSPAASDPLLEEPWREMKWTDKREALQQVKDYKPSVEGQQLRILLHGATGAGKSTFINSVQSVLRGRMSVEALADHISGDSFTKVYQTYKTFKVKPDVWYPFVFNDVMGLSDSSGVLEDDIILAFSGRVKDGYKFNPQSKLTEGDQFYNEAPTDNDKVHVLVCVIAAHTLPSLSDEVKNKIRRIRLEARGLGIPQVAVLTKVDEACPEVKKDLKNVYRSKRLKQMMLQFHADSGIPMNCIFPVRNYHEEISLRNDVDSLILSVLTNILNYGDDFISRKLQNLQS